MPSGVHGAPHRWGLHPGRQGVRVQALRLVEEFQPVIEVRPAVEDACRQIAVIEQLDLDLEHPPGRVAGLDIDDSELVIKECLLVVWVLDLHRDDRPGQVRAQDGVEEMDQQVTIGLGPQEGLEDAVNLGIDGMAQVGSVGRRRRCDKGRRPGEPCPAGGAPGSLGSGKLVICGTWGQVLTCATGRTHDLTPSS